MASLAGERFGQRGEVLLISQEIMCQEEKNMKSKIAKSQIGPSQITPASPQTYSDQSLKALLLVEEPFAPLRLEDRVGSRACAKSVSPALAFAPGTFAV